MARGHAFWVIVTGTSPTAFRARHKEDLLPTLHQLQRTQPDAVIRWFDRGKLWQSPIEAREALRSTRGRPKTEARSRDWRPGGAHVDPRAKFKRTRDEKRAQFKRRLVRGGKKAGPKDGQSEPKAPRDRRPFGSFKPRRPRPRRKPDD